MEQAIRGYFAVIQVVIGAVCMRSSIRAQAKEEEGKLTALTMSYLENIDQQRLRIAPELDRLAKLNQVDIGLPMIIESLRALLDRPVPEAIK